MKDSNDLANWLIIYNAYYFLRLYIFFKFCTSNILINVDFPLFSDFTEQIKIPKKSLDH